MDRGKPLRGVGVAHHRDAAWKAKDAAQDAIDKVKDKVDEHT